MGAGQSASASSHGFYPYASDSPTRLFMSGSSSLASYPSSFWNGLFHEYFLLRTSAKVPRNLLRSLDAATRALTRSLGRPDNVDAVNVSMMFRVVKSFLRSYLEVVNADDRTTKNGRRSNQRESSERDVDNVTEEHVRGGVLLLANVSSALVDSGAGRDRIYLVLGASRRQPKSSAGSSALHHRPRSNASSSTSNGSDVLASGEMLASAIVHALCECLVRLPQDGKLELKSDLINAVVTLLSARLYADRSLPSSSVAFLPFFQKWAEVGSNAQQLLTALILSALRESTLDPHRFHHRSEGDNAIGYVPAVAVDHDQHLFPPVADAASDDAATPTSSLYEDNGWGAMGLFQRFRSSSSRRYSSLVADASPGAVPQSEHPHERETWIVAGLARSSLLLVLLLVFGHERTEDAHRPFPAALALLSQNHEDISHHSLHSIILHWISDEVGMFFTYGLWLSSESFRSYSTAKFTHGGVSSPLYRLLRALLNPAMDSANAEVVYIPHLLLELLVEDEALCAELDKIQLPFDCLSEDLQLCSLEEAKTLSEGDAETVRMSIVILLLAIHCAHRIPTDSFLLSVSVAILGNLANSVSRVVHHASWSLVTLLDSLSSRYRSYVGASDDEQDDSLAVPSNIEDWDEDLAELSPVLGAMVEAVAGVVFGLADDGRPYVRNGHVLLALLHMRESLFDADSGVTIMILKNRDASPQCRIACSRLNNLLGQAAAVPRVDSCKSEAEFDKLLEEIQLLPLSYDNEEPEVVPLRFRYIEDNAAVDYFAPYVWSIVQKRDSLDALDSNMRFLEMPSPPAHDSLSPSIRSPTAFRSPVAGWGGGQSPFV